MTQNGHGCHIVTKNLNSGAIVKYKKYQFVIQFLLADLILN